MGVPVRRKNLDKLYAACLELREAIPSLRLAVHVATFYERACDPVHLDPSFDWGEWAEPDRVHHCEDAAERGRIARADAIQRWTWDNAAREAVKQLNGLIA